MEAAAKVKKPRASKKAAPASVGGGGSEAAAAAPTATAALAEPAVNQGVPEGGLATTFTQAKVTPPDLESTETSESSLRYCPVCENYLYMQVDAESQELRRVCRKCGFKEEDAKGGLVMEMMIQQKSSEGYKILLNEFSRKDPRLPHIRKNITCPNTVCDSNKGGKEPDVIYIKYDVVNLMYLYICDICGEQWHSRSRS
jgi:DNA-directed RNA polymerase subunit M/transcription elongation factor TFIIS